MEIRIEITDKTKEIRVFHSLTNALNFLHGEYEMHKKLLALEKCKDKLAIFLSLYSEMDFLEAFNNIDYLTSKNNKLSKFYFYKIFPKLNGINTERYFELLKELEECLSYVTSTK